MDYLFMLVVNYIFVKLYLGYFFMSTITDSSPNSNNLMLRRLMPNFFYSNPSFVLSRAMCLWKPVAFGYLLFLCCSCKVSKSLELKKAIYENLATETNKNHFVGIKIIDPANGVILFEQNADKYFTPASNAKIFTLYSALSLLPDSLPTAKYLVIKDTTFLIPLGDPTQMHPYFQDSTLLHFLADKEVVYFYFDHFEDNVFGPGWAWEDYGSYYSPERSALPLFGNVVSSQMKERLNISPHFFRDHVFPKDTMVARELHENRFYHFRKDTSMVETPFITSPALAIKILADLTGVEGHIAHTLPDNNFHILYSVASDSLYKRMMVESDNFLAEQMLIMASSAICDTISTKRTIAYTLDSLLPDLPHPPRWVDGSGLSRYNLFTPSSLVAVLEKLYQEIPEDRLLRFFPRGGISGTLKDDFKMESEIQLFAKSGSLGNNFNLSGYVRTKSGKLLIFSYMNNHFRIPVQRVKSQISEIINQLYTGY